MTPAITEAASQKPRRGRPPSTPRALAGNRGRALERLAAPDVRSRRALDDVHYRTLGIQLLTSAHEAGDTSCAWVLDPAAAERGDGPRLRSGILAGLGRILWADGWHTAAGHTAPSAALAMTCARKIAEARPTTRTAEVWLRRVRLAGKGES